MHELRNPIRRGGRIAAALLLLPVSACGIGTGVLGDYTDTDPGTGSSSDTGADSASSGEPQCTEDCDLEFAVTHLSAVGFELRPIHLLGSDTCEGPRCPASVSPAPVEGQAIVACADTQEAADSPLGIEEACRLSPAWLGTRFDVGFATPVERGSFERVRPDPADPTREEPYLWFPEVMVLQGPGTALRGDFVEGSAGDGDRMTRVVNESCAARLTALGIPWTEDQLETQCVGTWDDGGVLRPLRMDPDVVFSPTEGLLSTRMGSSCDTPEAGADTCCSACDRLLSPATVARYGVGPGGVERSANDGTAIPCNPQNDPMVECRELVFEVERGPAMPYTYAWDGPTQAWPLPLYDELRQTHPDDRPLGLEPIGAPCAHSTECDDGQECVGNDAAGRACTDGDDCVDRVCRLEWFGTCSSVTAFEGWCVDQRFDPRSAGACMVAQADFADGSAGDRLSQCDANGDGLLDEAACCDPAFGGAPGCDPTDQQDLVAVSAYDRHPSLDPVAACLCDPGQPASCADALDAWCEAPLGTASDPGPASPAGDHALPLVEARGGLRWDEDRALLDVRLATLGHVSRADVEACAEARGLVRGRSVADGWMANAVFIPERLADHDLALCSGSTYRLVFAGSDAEHHVRSAGQGTLDGRAEHVIETPQLRIVPDSLFPTDNLVIDSCTRFELALSNRPDPSAANLNKLELRAGDPDGPVVAGGPGCDPEASPAEVAAGAIPCLDFDLGDDSLGRIAFFVDEGVHGTVLQTGTTYFVVLPGVEEISQMADADAYAAAFHDACGMPLVLGSTPEALALWEQSFTVDEACPS
ncbi:hypothetical protein [Paraliomyxa miuraensis]|uniref:hypothetical protein n=1 Tax=Paraliomyxa miuraensis TaxID=376150 RepID=UPI0022513868|nr:hypothetical protein [Paraliomyxa miuraensis]MCX4239383.1 hypothetical protein [Paraliomyxa miuraensis]